MRIDFEKLGDRAVDVQAKLKAVCDAVPGGFGSPEGNYFFGLLLDLGIDVIKAIGVVLSAETNVVRLNVHAQVLAIRVAALRAALGDQPPHHLVEELFRLAADVHEALVYLAEVSEAVGKATAADDSEQPA